MFLGEKHRSPTPTLLILENKLDTFCSSGKIQIMMDRKYWMELHWMRLTMFVFTWGKDVFSETQFCKIFNQQLDRYEDFLQKLACTNDNRKFWIQFVFHDVRGIHRFFFLAIRNGDWHLSIKQMAAIFTAFDHQIYQKIISRYIADDLCMPASILTMFRAACLFTPLFCWSGSTFFYSALVLVDPIPSSIA